VASSRARGPKAGAARCSAVKIVNDHLKVKENEREPVRI